MLNTVSEEKIIKSIRPWQQCLTVNEVTRSRVIADGMAFGRTSTSDALNGGTKQGK